MRVAIIADLHGNLPALDAVLADLRRAQVDQLVCLGDIAAIGPQPQEVTARLRDCGCPVVLGNTDAAALRPFRLSPADAEGRRYAEIEAWGAAQLTPEDLAFFHTFQPTIALPLGDGAQLLCFHGSPRSNTDSIVATTPDPMLARLLGGYDAAVYAGGHMHVPFIRRVGPAVFLNPGSVGLPSVATASGMRHPPWAEYAVVEWRDGCLSIELRRVPIDVETLVWAVLRSGMPHAEWLASHWR